MLDSPETFKTKEKDFVTGRVFRRNNAFPLDKKNYDQETQITTKKMKRKKHLKLIKEIYLLPFLISKGAYFLDNHKLLLEMYSEDVLTFNCFFFLNTCTCM